MKIEKGKPLPDHTKLDYYECCVKIILEELFPEKYHSLVLADKPDLQGEDVGIEVTIANPQKLEEARNNWVKANSCSDPKIKAYCIERMAQLGVRYTGGVQSWPEMTHTFEVTKQSIENKINKIKNGNYICFQRNELFIFTDTWYNEDLVEKAKSYLFQESVSDYFSKILVLSQGNELHIFETKEKKYVYKELDYIEQAARNRRARQMVEEAEDKNDL